MSTEKTKVQDNFLNELRKQGRQARILLSNGKEIRGLIKGFDQFTVRVELKDAELLVYKSAVAIIAIAEPAPLLDEETVNNDD